MHTYVYNMYVYIRIYILSSLCCDDIARAWQQKVVGQSCTNANDIMLQSKYSLRTRIVNFYVSKMHSYTLLIFLPQ